MAKIGIIGFGVVGKAVAHGFVSCHEVRIYDKYKDKYDTLEDTVNFSDYIFVTVPTPTSSEGEQDLSYLDNAIGNITRVANSRKVIVIKSTVLPGTTQKYASRYSEHDFVVNPEFLTEANSVKDFEESYRVILGGGGGVNEVAEIYEERFPGIKVFKTNLCGAELFKYISNCFLAVKVSFLNEIYALAQENGIAYNEIRDMFLSDKRIGQSHVNVPGPDGQFGYGGSCFPKDIKAFIKWGDSEICKAAEKVNNRVRGK